MVATLLHVSQCEASVAVAAQKEAGSGWLSVYHVMPSSVRAAA